MKNELYLSWRHLILWENSFSLAQKFLLALIKRLYSPSSSLNFLVKVFRVSITSISDIWLLLDILKGEVLSGEEYELILVYV